MRVCLNCHKDAHDDKPFCPYCGYKLDDDNLLYHYTSIDTLNAILSNVKHEPPVNTGSDSLDYYVFCLRATHWMFFNDPLEYKFFFEKLIRYFESDNDLNRYTDKLKTAIYAASGLSGMPYIISLSKNRDSLDMWRNYSKNGTGVAIGFKPNIIDQICNKTVFFDTRLYDCRYLDNDTIMTEFVEMKDFFLDVFSKNDVNLNSISPLLESCAVFKHPCYISEREKRIVLFDFTPRASESKFRVSNGRIIPFREIKLPITSIKEIIIGPCADKKLNKVSIEMQLAAITHLMRGISIENSELPYRQV